MEQFEDKNGFSPEPAAPQERTTVFCSNCGAPADAEEQFCSNCGASLREEEITQPQPEPAYAPQEAQPAPQEAQPAPQEAQPAPQEAKPKKKKFWIGIVIGAAALAAIAVAAVILLLTVLKVELDKEELTLNVGDNASVGYSVVMKTAKVKKVEWISSDENVATVGRDGTINAVGAGTCTVTVKVNGKKEDSLKVTAVIPVSGISFEGESLFVPIGETGEAAYVIEPADATDKSVTWSSSNEAIAKVDGNGTITAVALGDCRITVTASNGMSATIDVTVGIPVTGITLDKTDEVIYPDDTLTVNCTVMPEDATDKSVTWTSSDESVATVDENGKITAKDVGTCTITATTSNGIEASVTITVKESLKNMFSQYEGNIWYEAGDDGTWVSIDTNPTNQDSDDYNFLLWLFTNWDAMMGAIQKINQDLGFSDDVYERMLNTTWSMGVQTAENDKYLVTWTYHPDKGLEVTWSIKG